MTNLGTIHGFRVIDRTRVDRTRNGAQGYVVLVDRGEDFLDGFQRYVVSLWFQGEESWCQGHYITDRKDARDEMSALVLYYSR